MNDAPPKSYLVKLDHYSGPLDLLLQLIRRQEMDILQIDIHKITRQYIEYLKQAPVPDLETAGDFIRMASILLYIKSKSLLPEKEQEEEPEVSELKEKLSRLLANYQKFQKAGELLYRRTLLERDCWRSPKSLILKDSRETKIEIDREKGLFQLVQPYHKSLTDRRAKDNYQMSRPIPSLLQRLKQTAEIFTAGARLKYSQLVLVKKEKYSRLLSFLSLLELSKAGFVTLFQKQLFTNIEILVKKTVTEQSIKQMNPEEEKRTDFFETEAEQETENRLF